MTLHADDSLSKALAERLRVLETERARTAELRSAYLVVEASAFARLGCFVASLRRSPATRSGAATIVRALGTVVLGAVAAGCGVSASALKASPSSAPQTNAVAVAARDVSAACRIHAQLTTGATVGIDALVRKGTTQDIADRHGAPSAAAYELYGWGKDRTGNSEPRGVCLIVDGKVEDRATSFYGEPRPDVAKALANPELARAGYLIEVPPGTFSRGTRRIGVAVVSSDGSISQSKVIRTITFR